MTPDTTPVGLLLAAAEPTRLRILNCLAAAPLFVSDLQAVLGVPQPTVSRHLQVLRRSHVVRHTPVGPFMLYRLRRDGAGRERLLRAILEAAGEDAGLRGERERAARRSRTHPAARMAAAALAAGEPADAEGAPGPEHRTRET